MKYLLVALLTCLAFAPTQAQDCEVKVPAIADAYDGDCKKGVAHGTGTATGTDTYTGEFKKGLPHGQGIYTWASGDIYDGAFEKGEKHGEGMLVFAETGLKQKGYWNEDEYIGAEKDPYTIVQKSNSILRVSFKRESADQDQLKFAFTRLGKPIEISRFNTQSEFGTELNQTNFQRIFEVHALPCNPVVNFQVQANRSATGDLKGSDLEGNLSFELRQGGTWLVTIDMQGTE